MSSHDHDHGHDDHQHHAGHAHGHSHSHGHHHHHTSGNIGFAFFLNFIFSVVELVGGLMIGSVSIVAGAMHDFGDSVSLGLAWILEQFANRSRDQRFNFGYRRFSLLSALISGVVISTGSVLILVESVMRLNAPAAPAGLKMIALACIGLLINGLSAWRLSRGQTQNEKVLTWHLMQDLASWALILVGGAVVWMTNIAWLDPALAILLAIWVLVNVVQHLKSTVYLFLQGRPDNFSEEVFLRTALAVPGVEHIDHLCVWSLDGESSILSARLHLHSVHDPLAIEQIKVAVRAAATSQNAQATLETCLAAHDAVAVAGEHAH